MKNKGGRPNALTELEELIVVEMSKKGVSKAEIAFKHGISVSTVWRVVKKHEKEKELIE